MRILTITGWMFLAATCACVGQATTATPLQSSTRSAGQGTSAAVRERGVVASGPLARPGRILHYVNPFAPLPRPGDGRATPRGELGRGPGRPWGSIGQWTSARSSAPNEMNHESQLRLVTFSRSRTR